MKAESAGTGEMETQVDPERSWFLYVGEIKGAGLNRFLVEPLSRRYGKPALCIHVVPDVLAFYPEEIFLVVGPGSGQAGPESTDRRNSRMSASDFAAVVSEDEVVNAVVTRILEFQGELFVNVFESCPELKMASDDRVRIIGPHPDIASAMNNKLRQHAMACEIGLPVPEGAVFHDLGEALGYAENAFSQGGRVFVSGAYSAGGSNSMVAATSEEIVAGFADPSGGILVTRYLEHRQDPTVLGVVAGEDDVYVASVADQNIQGTRFMGSTFPTVLGEDLVRKLKEITRAVGSYIGKRGYRGVFGCDFIVDERGDVYFIELNARKQGTTTETTLAMVHNLPGKPALPELEMMAVMEGRLPGDMDEMDSTAGPLCWGTYNYKAAEDCLVQKYVPHTIDEEDLFAQAVAGRGGHVVLDHVGPQTRISAGGFIARVVAAGPTHDVVRRGLKAGARQVQMSIK